ncbi:MAG: alpha-amylase family glycosyl hydrolase, partial [Aggregatilineales bacterium]
MIHYPEWTAELHHDGSVVYVRPELPREGDDITIQLRTPADAPLNFVFLQTMWDGEIMLLKMQPETGQHGIQFWSVTIKAQQPRFHYRFKLMSDSGAYFYQASGVSRAELPETADFKLIVDYDAPLWVRDAIFYQIFVDRFCNGDTSNDVQTSEYEHMGRRTVKRKWGDAPLSWSQAGNIDFYGGDLPGITQKLDYLADLGITGLYLNPIFTASSNHKYDMEDFYNVDKHFGGNEALIALRDATHDKNMSLMLDVTPNHISSKHPWHTDLIADENAPTGDYFAFNEKGEIETWLGVPTLIKLNYRSSALRDVMYRDENSVLRHWLQPPYSIDAWRLDVANMTGNLRMDVLDHE